MKRIDIAERPEWRSQADRLGFRYHSIDGDPCWDESHIYVFTPDQAQVDIAAASLELHEMCLEIVSRVVTDEALLKRLAIPEPYWDLIRTSWDRRDPSLYGRFDFLYDGAEAAKLLEYNADTPTTLYETGFFQWVWFEEQRARGFIGQRSDQFNQLQDKLIARFKQLFEPGAHVHFACVKDSDEDRATVEYLEDCAIQAHLKNHFIYVDEIGVDSEGRLADKDGFVIDYLFKLYPIEDMMREEFGPHLITTPTQLLEPPWKAILSNKGLLPLLWAMEPGHPNLLPSFFEEDVGDAEILSDYVRKPLFSREGQNVEIHRKGLPVFKMPGDEVEDGWIIQKYQPVPKFGDDHAVVVSWMVGDEPVAIGVREDDTLITQDLSRFVPHVLVDYVD